MAGKESLFPTPWLFCSLFNAASVSKQWSPNWGSPNAHGAQFPTALGQWSQLMDIVSPWTFGESHVGGHQENVHLPPSQIKPSSTESDHWIILANKILSALQSFLGKLLSPPHPHGEMSGTGSGQLKPVHYHQLKHVLYCRRPLQCNWATDAFLLTCYEHMKLPSAESDHWVTEDNIVHSGWQQLSWLSGKGFPITFHLRTLNLSCWGFYLRPCACQSCAPPMSFNLSFLIWPKANTKGCMGESLYIVFYHLRSKSCPKAKTFFPWCTWRKVLRTSVIKVLSYAKSSQGKYFFQIPPFVYISEWTAVPYHVDLILWSTKMNQNL